MTKTSPRLDGIEDKYERLLIRPEETTKKYVGIGHSLHDNMLFVYTGCCGDTVMIDNSRSGWICRSCRRLVVPHVPTHHTISVFDTQHNLRQFVSQWISVPMRDVEVVIEIEAD